jgi:hypothetical protein
MLMRRLEKKSEAKVPGAARMISLVKQALRRAPLTIGIDLVVQAGNERRRAGSGAKSF